MSAPASTPETTVPEKRKRRPVLYAFLLAATAGIAVAGWHYGRLALYTEETDNAYITGHVHLISAGVPGPLVQVLAKENEVVAKDQLLARIDPREFDIMERRAAAAMEQATSRKLAAEAKAAGARAADLQAQAMIYTAEAEVKGAEARLALAGTVLKRDEGLMVATIKAITQAEVDQARGAVTVAEAELTAAKAKVEAARATKDSGLTAIQAAESDIAAAAADVEVQKALIEEARRQKSFAEVVAPAAGRIGRKNAETGNRVQVGQSLYALVEENYWIIANFKETQLNKMKTGQEVEIAVDSLGGKQFKGRVDSFSPATGAQFALLPPDNATGNFTKVVQRVPVKITFDPESIKGWEDKLRPGLSTVVRVSVR